MLTLTIETFAQFDDPELGRLSVIVSDGVLKLQPAEGSSFRLSLDGLTRLNEILARHEHAAQAARAGPGQRD